MNRLHSISTLAAAAALFFSVPAMALGELTCETPDAIGVPALATAGDGPDGNVLLTRVEESATLEVTSSGAVKEGDPDTLFTCAVGPLPPLNGVNAIGTSSGQAYIEHGLSDDTRWAGLQFDVAVPDQGLAVGTDISVLSVDFDAASGGSEHLLVSVQRTSKRTGAELVVRRGPGAGKVVARLPLADGTVMLTWPGQGAPSAPLVVATGGHSYNAALAPGSHASAVRIGYLGLDRAGRNSDRIYIVDPTFVAR
jgi:hypothetical protein